MNYERDALRATRAALDLRRSQRYMIAETVCPFTLAEQLGLRVRFVQAPSLEGLYLSHPSPLILIGSERPAGRQRYTCAHELGHHVFGHGAHVDKHLNGSDRKIFDPVEYTANRFASALLMPKVCVDAAFTRRGWSIARASPEQVFTVAQSLGVGYTTLIGYLQATLASITANHARAMRHVPLAELRRSLAGFDVCHDVFVADQAWGNRSIDVEVGDVVLVPADTKIEAGRCVVFRSVPTGHLVAVTPGAANIRAVGGMLSSTIRVCRRGFTGLAQYRYLEDPDYEH